MFVHGQGLAAVDQLLTESMVQENLSNMGQESAEKEPLVLDNSNLARNESPEKVKPWPEMMYWQADIP